MARPEEITCRVIRTPPPFIRDDLRVFFAVPRDAFAYASTGSGQHLAGHPKLLILARIVLAVMCCFSRAGTRGEKSAGAAVL